VSNNLVAPAPTSTYRAQRDVLARSIRAQQDSKTMTYVSYSHKRSPWHNVHFQ